MPSMVYKLARVRELKAPDRRILFLAVVLLPAIALGLRWCGLRRTQAALVRRRAAAETETDSGASARRAAEVARLVDAAARHGLYRAPCLPVSLALGWLLQREGISSELRLGVRKAGARLDAHAWVEHGGVPLIETPGVHDRFAAFEDVAPRSPHLR